GEAYKWLRNRSPGAWERGLLSECSHKYSPDYSNITFDVELDFDLVPEEYKGALSDGFLEWYIIRQINGGDESCLVVDGNGFELLLVTPVEEGLCDQFVGKSFNKGQVSVSGCSFVSKSDKEVDGVVLGEYELILLDQGNSPAGHNVDYIFYVRKINGPESECTYEGDWGKYVYPD
ncbi:hypothetical protein X801_07261, partial [Opisthorchis viverrini]